MGVSLRGKLTILLIALAVLPQIATGIMLGRLVYLRQEQASVALHHEIASGVAQKVEAFILEREQELRLVDSIVSLATLEAKTRRAVLNQLLLTQRTYQAMVLLDSSGREIAFLSRSNVVFDSALRDRSNSDEFVVPFREQTTFYSPVVFNEEIGEPLSRIAIPILNRRRGDVEFVLVAVLRFRAVWEMLAQIERPPTRETFVIDRDGHVVAHQNPSVVLRGSMFVPPATDGPADGLSGRPSIVASVKVRLGSEVLTVVSEEDRSTALALASSTLAILVAGFSVSLLLAIALVFAAVRFIVHPIEDMAVVARAISAGELSLVAAETRGDELGDLAHAFNGMTRQLTGLIGSLHEKVSERTEELEKVLAIEETLVARLEMKNAELESLIYTLSHDLKSPLITINGFLGYVEKNIESGDDEQASEDLTRVSRAARKMQEMLNELLEVSRVGRAVTLSESVPVDELVREAMDNVAGRLHEQDINVVVAPDMPTVVGERKRLVKVIENLIDNAAKFMGDQPEPRIEVGAELRTGEVSVWVRDNGIGLETDHLGRVFNLFEKLNHATEGSGVGLAASRRIVETHGGRIWAESDGPGMGCRFCFTLPASGNPASRRSSV